MNPATRFGAPDAPAHSHAARAAAPLALTTALLVAGASAAGMWIDGLYRDPASVTAMFRGYDLVTLAVVAPLLAATLVPRLRQRPRARLLTVSLLAYCVYNYAYYVFGAQLNAVLLVHVAVFTCALYALGLTLAHTDVPGLASRFGARTPARTVAAVLALLGVALAGLWTSAALGFAISGVAPEDPSVLVVTPALTRLGAVLDLSLLVPAYVLAAVLLWRRRSWGFVLATMLLVSGALHQVSYFAAMVFQNRAGIPGAAYDPVEPVILGLYVAAATLLMVHAAGRGRVPGPPTWRSRPAVRATSPWTGATDGAWGLGLRPGRERSPRNRAARPRRR